ncbi:MAG TPA: hypothetical protein VF624_01300 [Tepidisphaeraceae bacterium]
MPDLDPPPESSPVAVPYAAGDTPQPGEAADVDRHHDKERQKFDNNALYMFSVLAYIAAAPFIAAALLGVVALVRSPNSVMVAGMLCAIAMSYALVRVARRLWVLARSKAPTDAQRLPI